VETVTKVTKLQLKMKNLNTTAFLFLLLLTFNACITKVKLVPVDKEVKVYVKDTVTIKVPEYVQIPKYIDTCIPKTIEKVVIKEVIKVVPDEKIVLQLRNTSDTVKVLTEENKLLTIKINKLKTQLSEVSIEKNTLSAQYDGLVRSNDTTIIQFNQAKSSLEKALLDLGISKDKSNTILWWLFVVLTLGIAAGVYFYKKK
jgi:regulator of replication initiation timing